MNELEFRQKVMVYSSKFYGYSYKLIGNSSDAQDVVQDLYIKLWAIRNTLVNVNNIEAYATTIIRNLCLDRLKKNKRKIINFESVSMLQLVDENYSTNENNEIEQRMNLVRNALAKLPEIQQKVFIMRDIEEMEFEEMAQILNIRPENVRVILSRARQKIRELIIKTNE